MGSRFRKIDYPKMLYETLRGYFSVTDVGKINTLYKYCAALIQPLIGPFNIFSSKRIVDGLIANSPWQIGQVTNVLNYLYDDTLKRIFITQSHQAITSATTFYYNAVVNAGTFGNDPLQLRTFFDKGGFVPVVINVPAGLNLSLIIATIEQMRLQGISYTINVF